MTGTTTTQGTFPPIPPGAESLLRATPKPAVWIGVQLPTPAFWQALLEAQKAAEGLRPTRPIPNKEGARAIHEGARLEDLHRSQIKYRVIPAVDFHLLARKELLSRGISCTPLGLSLSDPPCPITRRRIMTTVWLIVHVPTTSGLFVYYDWACGSEGDELAAAHTRISRRLHQGVLWTPALDDDDSEAQGAPGNEPWQEPEPQQFPPMQQPMFPPPGPPPQQQSYGPPQYGPPPQQSYGPPPGPPQYGPPPQQSYGPPPGPPQYGPPPQQSYGPPPHEPPPPPPPRVYRDDEEPNTPQGWVSVLRQAGWSEEDAEDFAIQPPETPIRDGVRERLSARISTHWGDNTAAAIAAWEGTGFTPNLEANEKNRPRPTGLQVLRYLRKMKDPYRRTT